MHISAMRVDEYRDHEVIEGMEQIVNTFVKWLAKEENIMQNKPVMISKIFIPDR